jgi:hypothetical protein
LSNNIDTWDSEQCRKFAYQYKPRDSDISIKRNIGHFISFVTLHIENFQENAKDQYSEIQNGNSLTYASVLISSSSFNKRRNEKIRKKKMLST